MGNCDKLNYFYDLFHLKKYSEEYPQFNKDSWLFNLELKHLNAKKERKLKKTMNLLELKNFSRNISILAQYPKLDFLRVYLNYIMRNSDLSFFYVKIFSKPMTVFQFKLSMLNSFRYPFGPLVYYFFISCLKFLRSSVHHKTLKKNLEFFFFFDTRFAFFFETRYLKIVVLSNYLYFFKNNIFLPFLWNFYKINFFKFQLILKLIWGNQNYFVLHSNSCFFKGNRFYSKKIHAEGRGKNFKRSRIYMKKLEFFNKFRLYSRKVARTSRFRWVTDLPYYKIKTIINFELKLIPILSRNEY